MLVKLVGFLIAEFGYGKVVEAIKVYDPGVEDVVLKVQAAALASDSQSSLIIKRIRAARELVYNNEAGHLADAKNWVEAHFENNGNGMPIVL